MREVGEAIEHSLAIGTRRSSLRGVTAANPAVEKRAGWLARSGTMHAVHGLKKVTE